VPTVQCRFRGGTARLRALLARCRRRRRVPPGDRRSSPRRESEHDATPPSRRGSNSPLPNRLSYLEHRELPTRRPIFLARAREGKSVRSVAQDPSGSNPSSTRSRETGAQCPGGNAEPGDPMHGPAARGAVKDQLPKLAFKIDLHVQELEPQHLRVDGERMRAAKGPPRELPRRLHPANDPRDR